MCSCLRSRGLSGFTLPGEQQAAMQSLAPLVEVEPAVPVRLFVKPMGVTFGTSGQRLSPGQGSVAGASY